MSAARVPDGAAHVLRVAAGLAAAGGSYRRPVVGAQVRHAHTHTHSHTHIHTSAWLLLGALIGDLSWALR